MAVPECQPAGLWLTLVRNTVVPAPHGKGWTVLMAMYLVLQASFPSAIASPVLIYSQPGVCVTRTGDVVVKTVGGEQVRQGLQLLHTT